MRVPASESREDQNQGRLKKFNQAT